MTDPCSRCKRTECPAVCYPKQDYIRALRKQGMNILSQKIAERKIGPSPCYKCQERHGGCHATCEKYGEWKAKTQKEADSRLSEVKAMNDADSYRIEGYIKNRDKVRNEKMRRRRAK